MLVKPFRWCLLFGCLFCQSTLGGEETSNRVLVIYGNADLSPWVQMYNESLTKGLRAGSVIHLQIEFLELAQYSDAEKRRYAKALYEKTRKFPPDLVVGVLPGANDFVHEYLSALAPGTDVLYVLPSTKLKEQLKQEKVTAIVDSYWSKASAETRGLIELLFPDTEQLYYIVGVSDSNLNYLRRTVAEFEGWLDESKVETLSGYTPDELRATFLSAPPNSVAMYVSVDHDRFGIRYTDAEMLRQIENDRVPIFGIQDTLMGAGVIGGSFTSAALYGTITAQKVIEILGQEARQAPTIAPGTLVAFDDQVLEKFGVDHRSLPEDVVHLNHEITVWEQYWKELLVGFSIFALQTILILLLYIEVRRRKRIDRERVNQSRLFESVINGILDAIIVTNVKGEIIAANAPGFEHTFGMTLDDVKGRQLGSLFNGDVNLEESISETISETMSETRSETMSCLRGEVFFPGETVIKRILDLEGETAGYFAVVRDISERLAKEEELKQAHKMEAVGNLAGGIAHDFNNILMAIIGNAELAVDLKSGDASQRELLERILRAADRARDIVKQIMSFSRKDEGDLMELVDIGTLLQESAALIETSFPSSITMRAELEEGLWLIDANPTQLQQIILNLCSNANHAMGESGTIGIKINNVQVLSPKFLITSKMPAGRYVSLSVSDSGEGIDATFLPHIFDPFFTTKDRGEGTGMGLAMVYRIVETHKAFIDVKTGPQGTCFTIYFPARGNVPEPRRREKPNVDSLPEGIQPRVLLVDDDELVLRATEGTLVRIGCEVVAFAEPVAALEYLRQKPADIDLLVTDQVMPALSGLHLIEKIKQVRPQLPTILCTGNAEVSDFQGLPGVLLLRKPYSQAQLTTLIASVMLPTQSDTLEQMKLRRH